ncbi:hypothetical protein F383_16638 [Gossypium arboreum]|uniref:Uncharacterized protein n=1 Tax=Gossypium arboreum TaxID=29729 RepID=A0A0B0NIM2_GOSAR|nr:hypothetical protein F383_16638 [Gossypium arboreum]
MVKGIRLRNTKSGPRPGEGQSSRLNPNSLHFLSTKCHQASIWIKGRRRHRSRYHLKLWLVQVRGGKKAW